MRTRPPCSATNSRPSGAIATAVGLIRWSATSLSTKPRGSTVAPTADDSSSRQATADPVQQQRVQRPGGMIRAAPYDARSAHVHGNPPRRRTPMPHRLRSEDLSFVERAPVVVRAETHVPASPEAVWPALADASVWPRWFRGMQDADYTSPAPHRAGSTRRVRVGPLLADETILAFDAGERFAFRVDSANLPLLRALVEVVTLERVGSGTRVVYRQAFEFTPWLRPFVPLLRGQMERGLRRGLEGLAPWVAARSSPS